ncbi:hypothetical protein ACH49_26905 [Streptomyces leeuwenhoekii]|uniref:Polyketide synthase-like methyltransferase domain-containing protein n=1 Tax=Streptomyces leeuwenhoekii TaxID=1437453 RepID=A0ABR5HRY4_STRLW|nr:methyltransferase domain-containing protein [Streptomyces leeuwenhoekii]KMS68796.1 hypothetical protein ACH49_26905 [Streptomyces leeuwenhoekii]
MTHQDGNVTPIPDEVGLLYDAVVDSAAVTMGKNLHFGYWEPSDSELSFDEATDRLTDLLTERLRIGPGSRLLDIGCGVGTPGVRIARLSGAEVTGISVSEEQVKRANALARSQSSACRAEFHQANAMELPFPDASFDAAVALESMIHMPDRGQVLREIRRVLRPGGRIVLTDFHERTPLSPAHRAVVNQLLQDIMCTMVQVDDYLRLLRAAGFQFKEMVDISEETVRRTFMALAERAAHMPTEVLSKLGWKSNPADMIDISGFGYLLVVAERPMATG